MYIIFAGTDISPQKLWLAEFGISSQPASSVKWQTQLNLSRENGKSLAYLLCEWILLACTMSNAHLGKKKLYPRISAGRYEA